MRHNPNYATTDTKILRQLIRENPRGHPGRRVPRSARGTQGARRFRGSLMWSVALVANSQDRDCWTMSVLLERLRGCAAGRVCRDPHRDVCARVAVATLTAQFTRNEKRGVQTALGPGWTVSCSRTSRARSHCGLLLWRSKAEPWCVVSGGAWPVPLLCVAGSTPRTAGCRAGCECGSAWIGGCGGSAAASRASTATGG